MIISHFNRYFEKHGRKTYIALGIIISLMFVVFVTPGDMFGGAPGGPLPGRGPPRRAAPPRPAHPAGAGGRGSL
jgi:hypothetical protein